MSQPLALGIDIGGTNTAFGLVDRRGNILTKGRISTVDYPDFDQYLDKLYEEISPLTKKIKGEVTGLGIGAPNGNFYSGCIEFAPNLPWKNVVPIAEKAAKRFDLDVRVTNDANAAAIGEMTYGVAKGMKDFIMITLGTGLGSGIVINGNMVYGHDGFAGELGHVIVEKGGRLCGCGRHGCLETYASATGIVKTMREILQIHTNDSALRGLSDQDLTSKSIAEAAKDGDVLALKAIDFTAEKLGEALANFIAFSAPEAIILFGGLARAGDLILKPTEKYMNENTLKIWRNKVKLIPSELKESDAAILGASALVWERD